MGSRRGLAVVLGCLAIATSGAVTAAASVDFSGVWTPGWSNAFTSGRYYKEYVYYGGGGSFQICAQANNQPGNVYYDCGRVGVVPSPQARLMHCGGHYALWYVKNGDDAAHTMTARLFENPC